VTVPLVQLITDLPVPVRLKAGSTDGAVAAIVEDSRLVSPGCLFVARPGRTADGRRFVPAAIEAGAVAVLTDDQKGRGEGVDPSAGVAHVITEDVPAAAAHLAERFHGEPSQTLRMLGVTGTNGKTTVATIVHQLLNALDVRCGLMGTVEIDDGRARAPAALTTPPAFEISTTLARMVEHECEACAMEVSSHALDQRRTDGLAFDVAVFTNLTGDHIDYHGSEEAYRAAKARLFETLRPGATAVINLDDPSASHMIDAARSAGARVLTTSLRESAADAFAEALNLSATGIDARLTGPWDTIEATLSVVGLHNLSNILQALLGAHVVANADREALACALAAVRSPAGRLEPVTREDEPFTVLVDYAHTDDALDNVCRALRPVVPADGRLIVVFGCGGDRDRTKRPRMARVACAYGDLVIITSDNPRTEDPQSIIDEVLTGVPDGFPARHLVDRREAIELAVFEARPGDIVLIAGKGHEPYQIIGTVKRDFDDRLIARAALDRRTARPEAAAV
jgi:UDP-N-acetylmuramoyl-L-alanyl-D-glutamate--2,6-diaminopimelate ligase